MNFLKDIENKNSSIYSKICSKDAYGCPYYYDKFYFKNQTNGIEIIGMKLIIKNNRYYFNYGDPTLKELKSVLKQNKIKGYSKMDKLQIIKCLLKL